MSRKKATEDMAPFFFHQGTSDQAYRYLGCHLQKTGEKFALNLSLSDRQREILLAGGTLNYTKLKG